MEPKKNPLHDVHRYSKHFFLIGLIISSSLAIMAFEWETKVIKNDCRYPNPIEPIAALYPVPVTGMDEVPKAEPIKKIKQVPIDLTHVEPATTESKNPDPLIMEPSPSLGIINIELPIEVPPDTFIVVERMPVPIGGYESFYKQVAKTIKYPSLAKRTETEGKVYVEFVINEKGDPINLKIAKGIGQGCDEEAKRVISMIKWEPGKQRGNPVLVKMTMSIHFRLK